MTDVTRTSSPGVRRHRARRRWPWIAAVVVAYIAAGAVAHLFQSRLNDLTLIAYAAAEIGGAAFIWRYLRTDWLAHPWGRHVMAFMVCMEIIFTLSLSRRLFGSWPGLDETLFLASVTFAGIVWWRYRLLASSSKPPAPVPTASTHD